MKVTATVVWSTTIEIDLPEEMESDKAKEAILSEAERQFDSLRNRPVIHECTDPDLID